mmetsp:Transcript_21074/g.58371  ORF Transcript_21074/g.58371 Transcript_21074/m.58371 type:complete len:541 (+) Transcript_21074:42-1664(+)
MSKLNPISTAVRAPTTATEIDVEQVRVQKKAKAKQAPLHEEYSAPLSFITDAVKAAQSGDSLNMTEIGKAFGKLREAYVRQCYEDIVQLMNSVLKTSFNLEEKKKQLFVIQGSSGVGKSTFLAYCVVRLQAYFRGKIILCHAEKSVKSNEIDGVDCQVWENGNLVLSGDFRQIRKELKEQTTTASLIVMDGCSLPISLEKFKGKILIAASPSLYIKNIEDAVFINRRKSYTMPALNEEEALAIASLIGISHDIVKTNLHHMGGVTRYLFEPGVAKLKVEEATKQVDASAITKMVSMQRSNKATKHSMVHVLILWKVDIVGGRGYDQTPRFELVSRYAECLVANKLALESVETLKAARQQMAPMSGAEGYAGALFEAYAIRTLQAGGTFTLRNLSDKTSLTLNIPAMGSPVVIETNKVTTGNAPPSTVRVSDGNGGFVATLLWPTTTNFPTFDCFYFHTDGKVYALQMTIAMIHDLKNSGADNAKVYFDKLLRSGKMLTYPAVFVVPVEAEPTYSAQKFKGNVHNTQKDMTPHFQQLVLGL